MQRLPGLRVLLLVLCPLGGPVFSSALPADFPRRGGVELRAALSSAAADEVARRLSQLAAPEGDLRQRAERWLAANVGRDDAAALATAARDGDAEVRRRISRVIAAADSDLWISTLFLGQPDERLQQVGERALRACVARFRPELARRGITDRELLLRIQSTVERSWPETIRLQVDATLDEACALLTRRGRLPLELVVDPSVAERLIATEPVEFVGTWDEVVRELAARAGVALEGHDMLFAPPGAFGADAVQGAGPAAFLRFCDPAAAGRDEGTGILVERCRELLTATNPTRRIAAARAVAASGWPAGLAWLDARYRELDDEAALEGLLRAASTGRVAPSIERDATIRALVEVAAAGLEPPSADRAADEATRMTRRSSGDSRACRIVDALGRLAPFAPDGASRAAVILDGWGEASAIGRWVRLAALEGIRAPATPDTPEAARAAAEVLGSDAPAWLLQQALRTWCVATIGRTASPGQSGAVNRDRACHVERFDRLLDVGSADRAFELARCLAHAGFVPPDAWTDRSTLPPEVTELGRVAAFAWDVMRGDASASAAHWGVSLRADGAGGSPSGEFASMLARLVPENRATLVRAWEFARATAGEVGDDAAMERVALVDRAAIGAGVIGPDRGERIAARVLPDASLEPGALLLRPRDLDLLGAVGGWGPSPVSERARRRLALVLAHALSDSSVAAVANVANDPLVAALQRSLRELSSGELDGPITAPVRRGRVASLAEGWRAEIQGLLRRGGRSPLRAVLSGRWARGSARAIDLAALDRRP